ncbi:hypothetical protein B0H11DRAFT_1956020 [Mycena galericulata]|nr:hypothetical protein B0H11DRAFT_1956020 [Mycena galericulata]
MRPLLLKVPRAMRVILARTGDSISPSRPCLFPELWEFVFHELGDEDLLLAACVCSTFNDRCIPIYFERKGVTREAFTTGTIIILSDHLRGLHLSRLTPPLHSLTCHFGAFKILRHLKILRGVLDRCNEIRELSVVFPVDVINAHAHDTYTQEMLLAELGRTLRAMTARTSTPFVIDRRADTYTIGRWGFPAFQGLAIISGGDLWVRRNLGLRGIRNQARSDSKRGSRKDKFAVETDWARPTLRAFALDNASDSDHYLGLWSIHGLWVDSGKPKPTLLITLNNHSAERLRLGRTHLSDPVASAAELEFILPHINLPRLTRVEITESISREKLRDFLVRHPTILSIHYEPFLRPQVDKLLNHPLVVPALVNLSCTLAHISLLLDTFGLSPHLETITVYFKRTSAQDVVDVKRALRRLSLIPNSILFWIGVGNHSKRPWAPISDEEGQIVGCLYAISTLRISADAIADARIMIPWLAMLPSLRHLNIYIYKEWKENPVVNNSPEDLLFVEEARSALPWVPVIDIRSW